MDKSKRRSSFLLAAGALLAAAGGVGVNLMMRKGGADEAAVNALWSLPLQDLSGAPQPLTRWKGKVLVVNFWATWCEPCREEVPALVRTHAKYASKGVEIVGISLDSVAKVKPFAEEFKISYPLVIASIDAIDVTKKLGNNAGGLPYTLVLDARGQARTRRLGGITEAQLSEALDPILSESGAKASSGA